MEQAYRLKYQTVNAQIGQLIATEIERYRRPWNIVDDGMHGQWHTPGTPADPLKQGQGCLFEKLI